MTRAEKSILIHPGFHKTGTTFLQSEVFSYEPLFRLLWCHAEADRFVVRPHDLDFDPGVGRKAISALRASAVGDRIDVVSSETLSGNLFYGLRDNAALANRLKLIFGDAKILITVRKQSSIIKSTYMMYLDMGGTMTPEEFFDQRPPYNHFAFDASMFMFDRIVEHYASLFGAENVIVMPQEVLDRDIRLFLSTLCDFCGVEAGDRIAPLTDRPRRGVGAPPAGMRLLRYANRFRGGLVNPEMRSALAPLGRLLAKVARRSILPGDGGAELSGVIFRRFGGTYADSNRRLQAFSPFDLNSLGYETAKPADPDDARGPTDHARGRRDRRVP